MTLVRQILSRPSSLSFPYRSRPPLNTAMRSGDRCKLPQRGLGRTPSGNRIWYILALNSDITFTNFPENQLLTTVFVRLLVRHAVAGPAGPVPTPVWSLLCLTSQILLQTIIVLNLSVCCPPRSVLTVAAIAPVDSAPKL